MSVTQPYTIVQATQHWVNIDGAWYRDCWIRTSDGTLRFVAILDEAGQ